MNSRDIDLAMYGAFIAEGIHDCGYKETLRIWDRGCLELIEAACSHAPFLKAMNDNASRADNYSFPGIFMYEVVSEFGAWWATYIKDTGDEPARGLAIDKARGLALTFFKQCDDEAAFARYKAAVDATEVQ